MRIRKSLSAAALAAICLPLLLTGCYSSASRLDVAPVKRIVPGTSTTEDVEKIFGPAPTKISGPNGKIVSRYIYRNIERSEDSSQYEQHWRPGALLIRTLTVLYDSRGTVVRKLHDESFTSIRRIHENLEVGPVLMPDAPSTIQKNEATSTQLIDRFGEPMVRTLDPDGHPVFIWYYMKDRIDRLGTPVGRSLIVIFDEQNRVIDHALVEENPRYWLFSGGDHLRPEMEERTDVGSPGLAELNTKWEEVGKPESQKVRN